jgi:hypothetical protein
MSSMANDLKKTSQRSITPKTQTRGIEYSDIVIEGKRKSSALIEVMVQSSPAGKMDLPVSIFFSENEARGIKNFFYLIYHNSVSGGAKITQAHATELGKQLSKVLFPPAVFEFF